MDRAAASAVAVPPRATRLARASRAALRLGVALLWAGAAQAQTVRLPASAPSAAPCVQVRIGNDEAGRWSCLNQALRDEVRKSAPIVNTDSPGERLAPIGQGLATPAATRQRLGDQYGKSVVPQRPAQHFSAPLAPPGR